MKEGDWRVVREGEPGERGRNSVKNVSGIDDNDEAAGGARFSPSGRRLLPGCADSGRNKGGGPSFIRHRSPGVGAGRFSLAFSEFTEPDRSLEAFEVRARNSIQRPVLGELIIAKRRGWTILRTWIGNRLFRF